MTDPVSSIARYLSADVRLLTTLSQNVANLTTPGYRAAHTVEGFGATLGPATRLDLADGALNQTGRPFDLALQGHGFFVVQAGDRTLLRRAGQFQLDGEGQLVDGFGHAVLGESGPITLTGEPFQVAENGEVRQGGQVVDQLSLVDVPDASQLEGLGNGLFAYAGDTADASAKVHQGALEGSNVDPGTEVIQLMEISRHAESVQRAISTYHAALVAGIDGLGKDS
jgi:flagellar basal-body rod protein FlgF